MALFNPSWPPQQVTFVDHTDPSTKHHVHLPQVHLPTGAHNMTHIFNHHSQPHRGSRQGDLIPYAPETDIRESGDQYILEMDLPGVTDKKSIIVEWLTARTLHVECIGEKFEVSDEEKSHDQGEGKGKNEVAPKPPAEKKEGKYILKERKVGPFHRNFTFPIDCDMEGMKAKLEAGVLRITVPKRHSEGQGVQLKIEVE